MIDTESLKENAGQYAAEFIQDGMIVGLGTGSTVKYFLQAISEKLKTGDLKDIFGIPSSIQTEKLAGELNIPLSTFAEHQKLDISVDGADEVDPEFNLIKGGGGALLREKVLAQASQRYIIIIDDSKYVKRLGIKWSVPVEVLPYAEPVVTNYIKSLGAQIRLRETDEGKIYMTDQNNYILDCKFGPIADMTELAIKLKMRSGIQEHGLFISLTTDVVIAGEKGIRHLKK